jgi:hypothetical protein
MYSKYNTIIVIRVMIALLDFWLFVAPTVLVACHRRRVCRLSTKESRLLQ